MEIQKRKRNRLKNFDYSSREYYYVTICTYNKNCIFGMENDLTEIGNIAKNELLNIPSHYEYIAVEKYIIMPDHIHAVISIGCHTTVLNINTPDLSTVVGLYKSGVSRLIHQKYPDLKVWQRSFYDEIIRNENALYEIFQYIEQNPSRWKEKHM